MATLQLSRLSLCRSNVKGYFNVKREIYGTEMKIGELAKATGLAPSRIRYYEAQGLIGSIHRGLNGYRQYSRETRQILEIIITAQQAGFSLDEIRKLLPQEGKTCRSQDKVLAGLKKKLVDVKALQARLVETCAGLQAVIARIEGMSPGGDCFDNTEGVLASLRDQPKPS
jgi:DNA-binding transcriptional MerR regulator